MIVPLLYQPGILKDGTLFQEAYCTDGEWVRFQRGRVQKMGGQLALTNAGFNVADINCFTIVENAGVRWLFYCSNSDRRIYRANIDNALTTITNPTAISNAFNDNANFQFQKILLAGAPTMLFMVTEDRANIFSSTEGTLWKLNLNSVVNTQLETVANIGANSTGGILYSTPITFLYGSNGTLKYSKPGTLDFSDLTRSIPLDGNKILYAANVRGGANTPTILAWTESNVFYITNVADGNALITLKIDPQAMKSTLLSSKAVIEYDGLFFWPGTDRFFTYNGTIQEVGNIFNQNYFFDNIDMGKRQLVYGFVDPKYGEMWWVYPEIANKNNPNIGCTRAIIFNKRENCWYDIPFQRSAAYFDPASGKVFSYGNSLALPNYNNFWKHDIGIQEDRKNNVIHDIDSKVTTPWMGFVALDPTKKEGQSRNKFVKMTGIEPDFKRIKEREGVPTMNLTINTKFYAGSIVNSQYTVNFNPVTTTFLTTSGVGTQGRFLNLTLSSAADFEFGNILLHLEEGDSQ